MNDIAKQATADKFLLALKKEHLSKKEAGNCVGITSAQVSCLFNKHYWDKVGNMPWEKALAWVNSGQGLQEYGVKHGKVLPEKEGISYMPEVTDRITPVPTQKEESTRLSTGQMVDMLIEERKSLQEKIEAIETLLKHYIS